MRRAEVLRLAVPAAVATLALAACGGPTPAPIGPTALARFSTSVAAGWPAAPHPDRGPTWISPDVEAKRTQLLFVSDSYTDVVYMYALPSLKVMGTITGFQQPQGECSDSKGDVWITDANAQKIYEVSHAGRLESTLSDDDGYPVGCAWDAKSGSVAVMNIFNMFGEHGEVIVYPPGSKQARSYVNTRQYYYDFAGYDGSGDLFFDGRGESGAFVLSELPAGAKSAETIKVSGARIYFPGMVQASTASGGVLVGDQECGEASAACIYQLTISGTTAKVTDTTKLENGSGGAVCDLVQGVEANGEIAGSDWEFCGYTPSATELWAYPSGGKPSAENGGTDTQPVGAALSGPGGVPSKSWMKPASSSDDLVYVSNSDGEVTVYDYATQALVGVLAAFETPRGECVDRRGNVYIADAGTDDIYEYAHGGTKAIKTLDDSPNEPNECSVDRTTGNLAVANSAGSIALYANASGKPTLYTDTGIGSFAACAYDDNGSLLTSGYHGSNNDSLFAWLPKHGSALVNINVPGPKSGWTWYGISGIQWDGKFFALDDGGNGVYQIALIHGQPYWVNQTQFDNSYVGSAEYGIYDPNPKRQGKEILVGFNEETYSSGVDYYPYPGGGEPGPTFRHGVDEPFAIAISLAK